MKKYIAGIIILVIVIFLILILTLNHKENINIIGIWKAIDTKNEYYYIFNKDKTCSYEMKVARLDCTYEVDKEKITILYKGNDTNNTYKYRFENDTLIITDDTGKDNNFIKEQKK